MGIEETGNDTESQTAEAGDITADMDMVADSMPDPTPGVAEREQAKAEEADEQAEEAKASLVDSDGNGFDASLHVTDANGEPVTTSTGKLRKRPGRKSGQQSGGAKQSTLNTGKKTSEQQRADDQKAMARKAGSVAAQMFMNTATTVGGKEFAPRSEKDIGYDESELMRGAFADYFEAKEWSDFPPGVALTAVILSYCGARLQMPETQKKVGKLASAWQRWKDKRTKKKKAQKEKREKKEGDDKGDEKRGWFGGNKEA